MFVLWLRGEFHVCRRSSALAEMIHVVPHDGSGSFLAHRWKTHVAEASSRDREWLCFSLKMIATVQRRLNPRAAKALCDSEVSALLDGIADILVGLSGGDAPGLLRRATFQFMSGEMAFCNRMQRFSEGAMLECTAHTFFRRFETKRQYPEEKVDSSRMKVRSLCTSVGMGEVKVQF
ncbi:hypothetical protein GIB67_005809 [Kingdonia uniflora]|uniref:Uncharacterized protein n=1 Tax=Kingdonia uniflora TaxID=39325 RepID=A0A7J7MB97_9MAGN|nr:hypothetical protein GIB67_005809 [Kingdonia uniflora]